MPMLNVAQARSSNSPVERSSRRDVRGWLPLVLLAVLVVFFGFAAPRFFSAATLTAVLKQGSVLAIVSIGMTYVLLCAEFDLSVGMMALLGASLCGSVFQATLGDGQGGEGAPPDTVCLAVVAPLMACLTLGLFAGVFTAWARLPSFVVTLALLFAAEGWAKSIARGESLPLPEVLYVLGNDGIFLGRFLLPYCAMLAAVVTVAAHLVLRHTRFGRGVYMTGGNREAARLAGVRTGLVVAACLTICAATAGLSGLLTAGQMATYQCKDLLSGAAAAALLGGTSLSGGEGGIGRTLLGVLVVAVLWAGLMHVAWLDDSARGLLTGVLLLVALAARWGRFPAVEKPLS